MGLSVKTEDRIQELKTEIRKAQEEYAKIHGELQKIQSPQLTQESLIEMWREIEQEQEFHHRMDVEEIIGVSKPIVTATSPLLSSLLKSPTANAPTITTLLTGGSIPNTNQPAITLNSDLIPPEKAVQLLSRPICGPPVGDTLNTTNTVQNLLSPSQSAPTLSMLLEKNKTATGTGTEKEQQPGFVANVQSVKEDTSNSKIGESLDEGEPMEIEEDTSAQRKKPDNQTNVEADEPDPNEEQQLLEVFKNIGNIELDIDVSAVIDDEEVDFLKGVDEESPTSNVEYQNKVEQAPVQVPASNDQSDRKEHIKIDKSSTNDVDENKSTKTQNENAEIEKIEIKIETSSDDSNDNIPLAAVATLENKERSVSTPTSETEEKSNEKSFLKAKVESAITSAEGTHQPNQQDDAEIIKETSPAKSEGSVTIKSEHKEDHEDALETTGNLIPKSDIADEVLACTSNDTKQDLAEDKHVEEETVEEEAERFSTPTGDEKFIEKEVVATDNLLTTDEDSKPDGLRTANDNAVDNSTLDPIIPSDEQPSSSAVSQIQENNNTTESVLATALPPPPPSSHISIADTDEDSCTTDISIITSTTKREDKTGPSSSSSGTKHTRERSTSQTRKAGSHDTLSKSTEDSDSSSSNRASKRSLLGILSNLSSTKSAQTIQNALNDEQLKSKYQRTCYRRIDFQIIKKSIENGTIRSVIDLQRDLLQLAQNVYFLFHATTATYKAAEVFKHEMQNVREFVFNAHEFEAKTEKEVKEIKQAATKQGRTGSRKSLRIS